MTVKQLIKVLYPNQRIRIIQINSCEDTDVCLKYADRIRPFLNYKIFRVYTANDILRIEVTNND